ncbi:MAG: nitrous oxide-stimulated promoter family protein [bacterium]|nr:nitrous oxide-stimulated promoter family protein [bacterium]
MTETHPRFPRETKLITKFISVYCSRHHAANEPLCDSCRTLLEYAHQRLQLCPYDPKPACKHCPTHCYTAEMRTRMKEVMRFSGRYFVKRGRLDWLIKYFLINKTLERRQVSRRRRPS